MSDWSQTYTGRKFYPTEPWNSEIHIRDIAHGLALCNRFAGHTVRPYSVAQHSVLMATYCPDKRWALLHDATEAYLGDIVRPLKVNLPDYKRAEHNLERVIASRFGLDTPMPKCVHEWDRIMLAAERRDLINHKDISWAFVEGVDASMIEQIKPWSWAQAEEVFLYKFQELFPEESCE